MILLTIPAIVGVLVLLFAGKWLPAGDAPETSDIVVVLAGDFRRTIYAAELVLAGYADNVLISRPQRSARDRLVEKIGVSLPRAEEIDKQILMIKGVPQDKISVFGEASISTYEEAQVLGKLYKGSSPRLLVVTSPYHVRRARMILGDALPNAQLCIVATPYEEFPEHWWKSQDAARDLLLEVAKIAFFVVGGRYMAGGA